MIFSDTTDPEVINDPTITFNLPDDVWYVVVEQPGYAPTFYRRAPAKTKLYRISKSANAQVFKLTSHGFKIIFDANSPAGIEWRNNRLGTKDLIRLISW
ncbi:hypothetical protein FDI69_gp236 [Rhodococcus phage Trina]|uniref:Uncharacterized protein n=1 Tax=Rhodococcus phage Trina TaxID=2027905 RepID=A0A2D1A6R9_9CAUD|nr:hypothetical protein FDI69_gp236 [Rhodococcus phage Trina]ASZ74950.1 hypothetical protein SEA_TRINA_150 [Rhodococcus phage Trina]